MQNGWRAEVGADRALHSARYHDDMRSHRDNAKGAEG